MGEKTDPTDFASDIRERASKFKLLVKDTNKRNELYLLSSRDSWNSRGNYEDFNWIIVFLQDLLRYDSVEKCLVYGSRSLSSVDNLDSKGPFDYSRRITFSQSTYRDTGFIEISPLVVKDVNRIRESVELFALGDFIHVSKIEE